MGHVFRVATRGSILARTQTEWLVARLAACHPELRFETRVIRTLADRNQQTPLHEFRERGVFVKEIESALLAGEADFAVHSMKDLPSTLPPGLTIGAVPAREDPLDALIAREPADVSAAGIPLPQGAVVGSSSLRRRAQIRYHRPDLRFVDLRGNVDTRLRKLDSGAVDAIILAVAGLARLGLTGRITARLPDQVCLPAICQGALAVECRASDCRTLELLQCVEDPLSRACTTAERALLRALGGGCAVPVGGLARLEGTRLVVQGAITHPSGAIQVRDTVCGAPADAEALGRALGERLLLGGGRELLQESGTRLGDADG